MSWVHGYQIHRSEAWVESIGAASRLETFPFSASGVMPPPAAFAHKLCEERGQENLDLIRGMTNSMCRCDYMVGICMGYKSQDRRGCAVIGPATERGGNDEGKFLIEYPSETLTASQLQ